MSAATAAAAANSAADACLFVGDAAALGEPSYGAGGAAGGAAASGEIARRRAATAVDGGKYDVRALNAAQARALRAVVMRYESVFLSGAAGTGKTYTVTCIVKAARANGIAVALTASTALAATGLACDEHDVVPQTVHRFAGVGLAEDDVRTLVSKVRRNRRAAQRWRRTQLWVIDEVSMLAPSFVETLDAIAREVRGRRDVPFGGMQMLFVGDFYQLPPVPERRLVQRQARDGEPDGDDDGAPSTATTTDELRYAFQTTVWREAVGERTVLLGDVFRQRDAAFVRVLHEVRSGHVSDASIDRLATRSRTALEASLKHAIRAHKARRATELHAVAAATATTTASDDQDDDDDDDSVLDDWTAPAAKRARLTDVEHGNDGGGGDGDDDDEERVECPADFRPSPEHAVLLSAVRPTLLVARNAQADHINACELAQLPGDVQCIEAMFECSVPKYYGAQMEQQLYNNMRRSILAPPKLELKRDAQVMLLANLEPPTLVNGARGVVIGFRDDDDEGRVAVAGGAAVPAAGQCKGPYPLVRFVTSGGDGGDEAGGERTIDVLVTPHVWKRQDKQAGWSATYTQVPLRLAYAYSIHKGQGMTISHLEVDLGGVFASGQVYVALSRATTLDGLVVRNFDRATFHNVRALVPDEAVVAYYDEMAQREQALADKKRKRALLAADAADDDNDA